MRMLLIDDCNIVTSTVSQRPHGTPSPSGVNSLQISTASPVKNSQRKLAKEEGKKTAVTTTIHIVYQNGHDCSSGRKEARVSKIVEPYMKSSEYLRYGKDSVKELCLPTAVSE